MRKEEKEKKNLAIQEFRYGVVAELANPFLSPGQRKEMIREKAKRTYEIPYSTRTTITEDCIRKWLTKYQKYGKDALLPKTRNDKGKCRSITEEETDVFLKYFEENSELTAIAAYKKLQKEGKVTSDISTSALSRMVIAKGLTLRDRVNASRKEKTLKFNFIYPLECVQADDMHACPVPDDTGKMKKAILIAFIDDATRRIVYANFSFTERSLEFEKGILHILKAHGRIVRLYVDNGSTFVSQQTQRIMDIMGIIISHSRPAIPRGRGKIERYFRTVRDQFLRPLNTDSIKGLGDLNTRFHTWLESEYHRNPHRGLEGKTPLELWLSKTTHLISLDPTIDLDAVFRHEVRRKIANDSTFTLKSLLYEVPSILIGKSVKILYDPKKPGTRLQVFYQGVDYGEAKLVDTYANTKVTRNYHTNRQVNIGEKQVKENSGETPVSASLAASVFNNTSEGGAHES